MILVSEACIEGTCDGWRGDTVFTLENGEMWAQTSKRCRLFRLQRPHARVWSVGRLHWLEIAGIKELVPVQRRYL